MTTSTSCDWTPSDLDYLLSLPDSELEQWLTDLSLPEQESLMRALLRRTEEKAAQPSDKQKDANGTVRSKAELAPRLGMSVPMLDRYVGQGAVITGPPYSIEKCQSEIDRIKRERGAEGTETAELRHDKLRAEIDAKIEATRARKLRNDLLERNTYSAAEVDQFLNENAARIRTRLEQFPDEAVVSVPADLRPAVRESIKTKVYELLIELAGRDFQPDGETIEDDQDD